MTGMQHGVAVAAPLIILVAILSQRKDSNRSSSGSGGRSMAVETRAAEEARTTMGAIIRDPIMAQAARDPSGRIIGLWIRFIISMEARVACRGWRICQNLQRKKLIGSWIGAKVKLTMTSWRGMRGRRGG